MLTLSERPDLAYPTKELARAVQAPRQSHMKQLKHLGRYIVGAKDYVQHLQFDQRARRGVIEVYVDANWA
eukprot:3785731-Heterocapsa_arctica.AAC.1